MITLSQPDPVERAEQLAKLARLQLASAHQLVDLKAALQPMRRTHHHSLSSLRSRYLPFDHVEVRDFLAGRSDSPTSA
jgi:hypothetical protein